jgi:hypothetical protein
MRTARGLICLGREDGDLVGQTCTMDLTSLLIPWAQAGHLSDPATG